MADAQKNLICAVCRDVYRSPRLLPCHHTFCLNCLEGLANSHGRFMFPCPSCRQNTQVPHGGVSGFQVNFYITEEELESARNGVDSAVRPATQVVAPFARNFADSARCPVHTTEPLIFMCLRCDQTLCIRCKLTKHENHPTEDLAETASRCKTELARSWNRFGETAKQLTCKLTECQNVLQFIRQQDDQVKREIEAKHHELVLRVGRARDAALHDLAEVSGSSLQDTTNTGKSIQQQVKSLRKLQKRLSHAYHHGSDADVVSLEKEIRQGAGSQSESVRVPDTCAYAGLEHGSVTIDNIEDEQIRSIIGYPVQRCLNISAVPKEWQ